MTRRAGTRRLTAFGVIALAVAGPSAAAVASGRTSATRATITPMLVTQSFEVAPGGDLTASIALTGVTDGAHVTTLTVTAYNEVDQPAKVRQARSGTLGAAIDTVQLDLSAQASTTSTTAAPSTSSLAPATATTASTTTTLVDATTVPVDATATSAEPSTVPATAPATTTPATAPATVPTTSAPGPSAVMDAAGQIELHVPTSTAVPTVDGILQLPASAVYPIAIDVHDDQGRVGRVISFVHRGASEPNRGAKLSVSLWMGQTQVPALDGNGAVTIGQADLDELTRLADALDAVGAGTTPADASTGTGTTASAVVLQPAMFAALETASPELYQRLVPLLTRTTLVAAPLLPLDASSATGANLKDLYTKWLTAGLDSLGARVAGARRERSLTFVDAPVSDGGLSLQRDLGVQVAVLSPARYGALDGNIGGYGDTTQLQSIGLADGTTVHAILVDRSIATDLADATSAPVQSAIDIAAQLLAESRLIEDLGGSVANHGTLLATADGGVPNSAVLDALVPLLRGSDRIRLVDPSDLPSIMSSQLVDGQPTKSLTLPATAGPDLTQRMRDLSFTRLGETGVASMLPSGSSEVAQWVQLLDTLSTTALSSDQASALLSSLNTRLDAFRHAVVAPEPFAFTLTGQNSVIRFRLRNTSSTPLVVKVQMAAAKMNFPNDNQLVTLAPQASTEVAVKVEARTNGTQGVRLSVLTPATDTKLVDDVTLKAQVRALTGLGQLLMGAFVLVVLTWWVHHVRMSRRQRGSADSVPRHPAAGSVEDLSPDAAASSLPPS